MREKTTKLAIFKRKEIRKTLFHYKWWFSVIDVCGALTDSRDVGAYWRKLKQRLKAEGSEIVTNCHGLKLESSDGRNKCNFTKATNKLIKGFF